ncbi:hypothetical protein IQ247_20675, partial [Plectonema cf. radiosum LEGE 06105]
STTRESSQTPEVIATQLKSATSESYKIKESNSQNPEVIPTQLKSATSESSQIKESNSQNLEVTPTQSASTTRESSQTPEVIATQLKSATSESYKIKESNSQNPEVIPTQLKSATSESSQIKESNSQNLEVIPTQSASTTSETPQAFIPETQVTQLKADDNHPIAASDTVPARLTPGEFVVNSQDAQKNLPLLEHINNGGTSENNLPDSTSNIQQKQQTNSLISPSLGLDITKQRLSLTNNQSFNSSQSKSNDTFHKKISSNNYSSPPLIFKKANTNTSSNTNFETPSNWSNIEELINTNNDNYHFEEPNNKNHIIHNQPFHDSKSSFNSQNSQNSLTKQHDLPKGFAKGGEVKDDISTEIKPVTETINMSSDSKEDDQIALESLAREVYTRLRQQLEIEKERQGIFTGRLPW